MRATKYHFWCLNMIDPVMIIMVAFAFCIAGFVKGIVGMGLPTVSLGILSLFVDLPSAMALLVVPSLVTNIWQAFTGGQFTPLLRRLWLFLFMAITMVHVGSILFTMVETALLRQGLGALLLIYALFGLIGKTPKLPPHQERIFGPICGAANGLLAGLTGVMFVPGTIFLQAIGLSRDLFVQAMGMLFAASTASWASTLPT